MFKFLYCINELPTFRYTHRYINKLNIKNHYSEIRYGMDTLIIISQLEVLE